MRVSDVERNRSYTHNVEQRLYNLNRIQQELGTGKSLFAPSEDLSRADQALTAKDALASDTQFLRNIDDSKSWVDTADTQLQSVVSLINDISSLAEAADNSSESETDRQNAAAQIDQKLETLMGLVNSKNGNRYLFGGYGTTSAPFTAVRDANGRIESVTANSATIAGKIYRDIGEGDSIQINVSGVQLFQPVGSAGQDGDLFYVVSALRDTIANNDTPPPGYEETRSNAHLRDQLASIRYRISVQQTYLGSIGQRLTDTEGRIRARDINLTNSLEQAQGVDTADLVSRLATEQGAYNALGAI